MTMPTFLQPLDFEAERSAIITAFQNELKAQKGTTYTPLISDDYNILISCILYRLGLKIDSINHTIANNYLEYSSGPFLDALVAMLDLKRFSATAPLATAKITAKDDEVFIQKGTKFVSSDGAVAYAIADSDLKKGDNEIILQGDKEG